jgi:tetratricopeptide (TPR) repeat protein
VATDERPGTTVPEDPLRGARAAVQSGRFREAWTALEDLAPGVRRSPEWQLLAAVTHFRLGEFARCRAEGLQARDGFRALGDADGELRAENTAAAGAFALGDLDEAERGFQRGLNLAQRLNDDFMTARFANNLGNIAYYRGEHAHALSYYRLAAANFERLGSLRGIAESWNNMSIVSRELRDHAGAAEASERAVDAAERAADLRLVGEVLAGHAETHAMLGDYPLAQAQLERALRLAREFGDRLSEAEALRVLSGTRRAQGAIEEAERLARDALRIAQAVEHPWATAEVQRDLGELYAAGGRTAEAATALEAAARAFERLGAWTRAEQMRLRAADASRPL